MPSDTIVIGGGLVGAATAYGLAREGLSVTVLDEGDVAFRASRGNFGLVWVQSKGDGYPDYAIWTRKSADLWPSLDAMLKDETGVSTFYAKPGGVHFCLSETEMDSRRALLARLHNVHGVAHYGARIVDRQELDAMLPGLGPEVVGGTYCEHDGHASPLYLLRALHDALKRRGGTIIADARATGISRDGDGYAITTRAGTFRAGQVVLAAGLGNKPLGEMVGLDLKIAPLKGQILVTERTRPRLSIPTHVVRQTGEGSILIGDSHEDVGFDVSSSSDVMATLASRAIRMFPFLKDLRIVRAWAALRIMSPDGFPIYQQSETHPGVFSVNCHSGVTLAGSHALALAPMIARGELGEELSAFTARRFNAPAN
ncbi:FAD-dependent oxidoreductase [Aurantimonas sp. C2-6-R+9]|uniref:NAD(P)/FAD-dependent oxidoreductase n=1 Tax=unclassified Aurantimonas TaxID=2638230 RepID=UPI002E17803A|nr:MULTISPECIES: FAD-dependent oxidoreductase [unclassified Aurantimonas]MEC5292493.1 FAD-dependent oxidoreductase [Aurantimonas sp. C2-3-R2]MEC5382682.1 FAD-dependent oxidoreductase [Aurantimonas sp. C2-6-R+9]MEC5413525.1 FAD-dependent oxidoreductase [Aurantimonas sp. C2-4-R8]